MANKPIKFKSSPHEASEQCILPSLGPPALSPFPFMPSPALGLHDNRDRSLIAALPSLSSKDLLFHRDPQLQGNLDL
jgi:hypothetical protein